MRRMQDKETESRSYSDMNSFMDLLSADDRTLFESIKERQTAESGKVHLSEHSNVFLNHGPSEWLKTGFLQQQEKGHKGSLFSQCVGESFLFSPLLSADSQ